MSDTGHSGEIDFEPAGDARALVSRFIDLAVDMRASDLFLTTEDQNVTVSVRHLGAVQPVQRLELNEGRRCMNYIKALAGIDLTERRRPLDGHWKFDRQDGSRVDLRINTIPTLYGEDFALRVLLRDMARRELDQLGLMRQQVNELRGMINNPGGLILVTGPSGSGKTTTLYACLHELNDGTRKINTIEDPIEYAVSGIRQSQTNVSIDLDFPELLRSVLRQTPDVILIGEIRDGVTAQTAIRAANSGHLVLSTLHAPLAAGAVQSMLSLGVNPHFLSTSLRGIITQRLVRTLCSECRVPIDVTDSPMTFDEVKPWLEKGEGETIYAPGGCAKCHRHGYIDRTGVFEVLTVNREIRRLISEHASSRAIQDQAIDDGMIEFRRSGLITVARGVTSMDELLRIMPAEQLGLEG